jgi:DNA-directed RNA polymerase specialized sigma24 family protein
MTYRRRTGARRPPKKPRDAASGALFLRQFMLSLFDREDGKAADWPLIAETLLREAFYALDQAPTDPRAALLLRGIHSDSYDRLSANPPATLTPLSPSDPAPPHATSLNSPRPDDRGRLR